AVNFCTGDPIRGRTHGAVAGRALFDSGGICCGEDGRTGECAGGGAEGGGEHHGIFLRGGESEFDQEIAQGGSAADGGEAGSEEPEAGGEKFCVYRRAGEPFAGGSGGIGAATWRESERLGK